MTAATCLGMVTGEALAQERERSERREGDRRERAERDNDRERPRGELSRSGERSERGNGNRTERQRRPQSGGFSGGAGFGGRPGGPGGPPSGSASFLRMFPIMAALDADGNGEISAEEIKAAPAALKKLDKNKDGKLTEAELRPTFSGFGGSRGVSVRGGRGGFGGRVGAPQVRPSFEGNDRQQPPRGGGERGEERRRRPSRPRE